MNFMVIKGRRFPRVMQFGMHRTSVCRDNWHAYMQFRMQNGGDLRSRELWLSVRTRSAICHPRCATHDVPHTMRPGMIFLASRTWRRLPRVGYGNTHHKSLIYVQSEKFTTSNTLNSRPILACSVPCMYSTSNTGRWAYRKIGTTFNWRMCLWTVNDLYTYSFQCAMHIYDRYVCVLH